MPFGKEKESLGANSSLHICIHAHFYEVSQIFFRIRSVAIEQINMMRKTLQQRFDDGRTGTIKKVCRGKLH